MDGHRKFSEFAQEGICMDGEKVKIEDIINKEILVIAFKTKPSKYKESNSDICLTVQFQKDNQNFIFFTGSAMLNEQVEKYRKEIPFLTIIRKVNKYYTFS